LRFRQSDLIIAAVMAMLGRQVLPGNTCDVQVRQTGGTGGTVTVETVVGNCSVVRTMPFASVTT